VNYPPCHPKLRAGIAEALASVLGNHSPKDLGDSIGRNRTTLHRRDASLADWPAEDLFLLAAGHPQLRSAIADCMAGSIDANASPLKSQELLLRDLRQHAVILEIETKIMGDGQIDGSDLVAFRNLEAEIARQHAAERDLLASLSARIVGDRHARHG
jgi:hypothetical protein